MASLKVLSLKNCRLRDLAGIAAFSSLTEAQFSCNFICSVSALALSPCLTAIDLSDNNITDP
jgi:Leucine-rich repeat (LRR) protein